MCTKYNLMSPIYLLIVVTTAMNEPHEGKRKMEMSWPIFRIHHQRSRYIYDMYYKKKKISKDLYEYCLREVNLITFQTFPFI